MTAQKGKDLLLKVDTDGAGSFVTVAGLRAYARLQRGNR
jgi:predicted secreted protein